MSVLGKSIRLKERWERYADAIIEKAIRNRYAEKSLNSLLLNDTTAAQFQADVDTIASDHESQKNPHRTLAGDIGSYTAVEELARSRAYLAKNAIPLDRFGDLSFLPIAATGTYEGTTTYMFNRSSVLYLEKDNTLVMIRNGTDGKTSGAYYSFLKNAVNTGDIAGMTITAMRYRPTFLTNAENVAYIYDMGNNGMLAGRIQSTGGVIRDVWFMTMINDTLDGNKHIWNVRLTPSTAASLSLPYNNMHDILLNSEMILLGTSVVMLTYYKHQVFMRYMRTAVNTVFNTPSTTSYTQPGVGSTQVPVSLGNGQVGLFNTGVSDSSSNSVSQLIRTNQPLITRNNEGIIFDPLCNGGTKSFTTVVENEDGTATLYLNMYAQLVLYWNTLDEEGLPTGLYSARTGAHWLSRVEVTGGGAGAVAYPDGAKTNISFVQGEDQDITPVSSTNHKIGNLKAPYTEASKTACYFTITTRLLNSGRYVIFAAGNGPSPDSNLFLERNILRDTIAQQNIFKSNNLAGYRISTLTRILASAYGSAIRGGARIVALAPTGIVATQLNLAGTEYEYIYVNVSNMSTGGEVDVPSITYEPGYKGYNLYNATRSAIGTTNSLLSPMTHIVGNARKNNGSSFIEGIKNSGYKQISSSYIASGSASMTNIVMRELADRLIRSHNMLNMIPDKIHGMLEGSRTFVFVPQEPDLPGFVITGCTVGNWLGAEIPEEPGGEGEVEDGEVGTIDDPYGYGIVSLGIKEEGRSAVWLLGTFDPETRDGVVIPKLDTVTFRYKSSLLGNNLFDVNGLADFATRTTSSVIRRLSGIWIYETPAGFFVGGTSPIIHNATAGNGSAGEFMFFYHRDTKELHPQRYFTTSAAMGTSNVCIALPNKGLGGQATNTDLTDSGTKVIADMYILEPEDITRVNVRPVAQSTWFVPLSTQVEQGLKLHITQSVPCFMQGQTYNISARTITFPSSNQTYAVFVNLSGSSVSYSTEIYSTAITENPNKMFIGTVTTGQSNVVSVDLRKTTRFGGVTVSAIAQGNSIPTSQGRPDEHAYLSWR